MRRIALFASLLAVVCALSGCERKEPVTGTQIKHEPASGTKVNAKDGAEMAFIPAGEFLMGDDDIEDNPRHKVTLSGYWIYKNDVTVAEYRKFCGETGRQMPDAPDFNTGWQKEDHPIVNVSWEDAKAYCAWAGVSLPTEAQWEKAARGTEGRKFPWGDEFVATMLWCSKENLRDAGGTAAVGSFPPNAYGLHDMAGNVCQWCLDTFDESFLKSPAAQAANPSNTGSGEAHVLRGGSWLNYLPDYFQCARRLHYSLPTTRGYIGGFRCTGTP